MAGTQILGKLPIPCQVLLVKQRNHRLSRHAKLREGLIDRLHLRVYLRACAVHHMQDEIRVAGFLQGALKSLHQMVGKLSDEADRVRKQQLLAAGKLHAPGGGIERGEKLILRQNVRPGQGVEKRGLSRVRIAHDGRHGHRPLQPLLPRRIPVELHIRKLPAKPRHPASDQPPVCLQLFLSRPSRSDAAAQTGQALSQTGKPGQPVA